MFLLKARFELTIVSSVLPDLEIIIFKPLLVELPKDLTFDYGDLNKLKKFMPYNLSEGSDPWI